MTAAATTLRAALDGLTADDINTLTTAHLNGKFVQSLGLMNYLRNFVRADGVQLWDADGRAYVDFVAGYGSVPFGHNPPVIIDALTEVMQRKLPHFVLMAPEALPAVLARELAREAPGALEMAFFASSGSEAIDGALKLARAATTRQAFVYAKGGYHGATFGAMTVTDDARNQVFAPLGRATAVPWGDARAVEAALRGRDIAAVVLEPMQAEGGMRLPPPGYLKAVADACRRTGTLLILDEVQTGFARTGPMFVCQAEGVTPDILVLAKGMSGGMVPVSCYLTTQALWQAAYGTLQTCELHCTTYRGGPLACAAALATLEHLREEGFVARVLALGTILGDGLRQACAGSSVVREVRGRGLLWGIELGGLGDGVAGALAAQAIVVALLERGYVTQVCTLAPTVIRVEPSLTIERAQLDGFVAALAEVLREHASGRLALARSVLGKLAEVHVPPRWRDLLRRGAP